MLIPRPQPYALVHAGKQAAGCRLISACASNGVGRPAPFDLDPPALTYSGLTARDAEGRVLPAWFQPVPRDDGGAAAPSHTAMDRRHSTSAAAARLRLVVDTRGACYPLTIDPIAQQAYLKASNTDASDNFGCSVGVSGDTALVGGLGEASPARGANGDHHDNSALGAGAVYVFTGSGVGPTVRFAPDLSAGCFMQFEGHAGFSYELLRAASLGSSWDTVDQQIAPPSGLVELRDASPPPGKAFYRAVQPPRLAP